MARRGYLIDLKCGFRFQIWEIFFTQDAKIILREVRFNPCEVKLNVKNLRKLEKLKKLESLKFHEFSSVFIKSALYEVKFNHAR